LDQWIWVFSLSKVYNSNIYKIAKTFCKDAPELMKLLDTQYLALEKYRVYAPIRQLITNNRLAKNELQEIGETAKNIKTAKGRVE
jgi:hypothetical protein